VFVTLFNLQGAHRSAAGFYLTTLFIACQALFSSFFETFFGPQHSIAEWFAALAERLA
jgi:hypothetical protein